MAMIAMEDRGDMARSSCPPEEREEGGGGEAWDSPSQSQPLIATIDDSCRLRILHPEVYDRSVDLLKASSSFRANIARFHEKETAHYWKHQLNFEMLAVAFLPILYCT
eukprot:Gb_34720 [translate_table: standard]